MPPQRVQCGSPGCPARCPFLRLIPSERAHTQDGPDPVTGLPRYWRICAKCELWERRMEMQNMPDDMREAILEADSQYATAEGVQRYRKSLFKQEWWETGTHIRQAIEDVRDESPGPASLRAKRRKVLDKAKHESRVQG